ncbi:LPXTG cell wall anchor domain-containing protein [Leucobacter japonicus]|nr:LPXTG cell wall anchor domain-containing protein [Leucobacter japonicus]
MNTGGESLIGLGAAGIVLLLAGAGLTLAMRRRHALRRD